MVADDKLWRRLGMTRRQFLRAFGIASGALTLAPRWWEGFARASVLASRERVYVVKNGDCFQNVSRLWELLDGVERWIAPTDVVVIKGNAQWSRQGYTHTGCIKGVVDEVLAMPGYDGEIHICDNVQVGSPYGFTATPGYQREHNWPDHNWNSLAAAYQSAGEPVAATQWLNSEGDITGPADGPGWIRSYFPFYGRDSYFSYPVFASSLTPGRLIDMRYGVWEDDGYTGRDVKAIVMATLNNHGSGGEDYAGVTSAIKSFLGATEMHNSWYSSTWNHNGQNHYHVHSTSYSRGRADYAGELTAQYIRTMYAPVLYITAAIWSGHVSRTGDAVETKTVLAGTNPATLDYVACRDVISPHASWLDPDADNNTRRQITGCIAGGVGTIDPDLFEVVTYDFDNPTVTRLEIDRKIRDFRAGLASEAEVKALIQHYMEQ